MLSFFPRGVLDEILNLIESVSEVFSSYSFFFLPTLVNLFKASKFHIMAYISAKYSNIRSVRFDFYLFFLLPKTYSFSMFPNYNLNLVHRTPTQFQKNKINFWFY